MPPVQFTRNHETGAGTTIPRFFIDSEPDPLASEKAGRPIYREMERVQIFMPGNRNLAPVKNVTDEHRQRWPDEYKAFKEGNEVSPNGTPLEQWNILTKSMVHELKALHLRTVEDVKAIPDSMLNQLPFGRRIRDAAAAYLDDAEATALISRYGAENDRLTVEVARLSQQHEEMKAQNNQMFAELQALRSAPHPFQQMTAASQDPIEQAKFGQHSGEPARSAFDNFQPKRRGRPPRVQEAETEAA